MPSEFNLDQTLIDLSDAETSASWTIRDSVEGLQIFGGIGSGKTSGSGRCFALKYLEAGYGGLVLTAKHDEKDLWLEYCREANRLQDLIIVEPGGGYHFNFLQYESSHAKSADSTTVNLVQVLKTVIRANKEKSSQKTDDQFWETALDMLLANTIDLCQLAYGKVTVQLLYEIAQTAPRIKRATTNATAADSKKVPAPVAFNDAFTIASEAVKKLVDAWRSQLSEEVKAKIKNDHEYTRLVTESIPIARRMYFISTFFNDTYKNLADKTRSIVDFSLMGFLYNLLREPTYSLFCRHASNFTPEDCLEGKIILLSLPVKDYHKTGQDCQILFKYIWQRAMERRRIPENGRPVFLWADEAQHFLHEHDADYQATARSSCIATVYISQNLPNYYASLGGETGTFKVNSFLGTLGTKVFHANADVQTNEYASRLIGQGYKEQTQISASVSGQHSSGYQISHVLEPIMRPEQFVGLKTGGPLNHYKVEGVIHIQGKQLKGQWNHKKLRFTQHFNR